MKTENEIRDEIEITNKAIDKIISDIADILTDLRRSVPILMKRRRDYLRHKIDILRWVLEES